MGNHAGGTHFSDRLFAAIQAAGTPACVGIDPVLERLPAEVGRPGGSPAEAITEFGVGVVEAAAGLVGVVKPQAACFERYGAAGVAGLARVIGAARDRGLVVILDAKRGDIGVTAEHYAAGVLDGPAPADAVTVSAYLGADTIEPWLRPGRGVFALVRTSNPGSDAVQGARLADGRTVAEMMADLVRGLGDSRAGECGLSSVGAVVGATKPADARALRERMPDQYFLVPGYGAQGGTLDDLRGMVRGGARSPGELGVVVTASRSVLYPAGGTGDWRNRVREAAKKMVGELAGL